MTHEAKPVSDRERRTRDDAIRLLYRAGGITLREIGERFGVSKERIRQIVNSRPRRNSDGTPMASRRNTVGVSFATEDKRELRELAAHHDMSMSRYVHDLVIDHLREKQDLITQLRERRMAAKQ